MRNLWSFIVRYYFFFLFLLLQATAIFLLARNNHYHRRHIFHSGSMITGFVYRHIDNFNTYLGLRHQNLLLSEENTRLRQNSAEAIWFTDTKRHVSSDSLIITRFEYINASVINNSVNRRNNYLTLNKGSRHGVEKDMGVIVNDGVVGIVHEVSAHFASVLSLLHKDMQLSVRIKKNDQIGTLSWEGGDYRYATMSYIPSHVELLPGDSIVTSGFSSIFPSDIYIGRIEDFEIRRGENFFTARVKLAVDFNRLRHVHVVSDLLGDEVRKLESNN